MSRTKRTFTAEFKTKIVLEVIEGRRTINEIAAEHNLQPNMVRNWKKDFLDKASLVFDDKREENTKQKLEESRKERNEYAKKVGQLTMQVD
ncbi:transposase-like protein [Lachnospiraceae bacterium PFB1-21]